MSITTSGRFPVPREDFFVARYPTTRSCLRSEERQARSTNQSIVLKVSATTRCNSIAQIKKAKLP